MNNWICQKCNTQNTANFCMNCGASANAESASDLPPTVIGMLPPIPLPNQPHQAQNQPNFGAQNQPNQFQNQPNFEAQNQPNFAPTQSPPVFAAPKKSSLPKVLLIGGIVGLLVVGAVGFLLYVKVIDPYLYKQKVEKRERDNQSKANGYSANALLPESVTSKSQTFKRGQVIDKFQLFQLTKDLPPEMKSEIKDINDAAAADYTNAANQKLALQIFKYNSPEKAKNACEKIGQEMIKNKNNFVKEPYIYRESDRPTYCGVSGEGKNGEYVGVNSLYGFLYINTGNKDYAPELSSSVWYKLTW